MKKSGFSWKLLGIIVMPYLMVYTILPAVFQIRSANLVWWLIGSVAFLLSDIMQKRANSQNAFAKFALAINGLFKISFIVIFLFTILVTGFFRVSISEYGKTYVGDVVAIQPVSYSRGTTLAFDIKLDDGTVIRDSLSPNPIRRFTCVAEGMEVGDKYEIVTFRYFGQLMASSCKKVLKE